MSHTFGWSGEVAESNYVSGDIFFYFLDDIQIFHKL